MLVSLPYNLVGTVHLLHTLQAQKLWHSMRQGGGGGSAANQLDEKITIFSKVVLGHYREYDIIR